MKIFKDVAISFRDSIAYIPFFKRRAIVADNGDVCGEEVVQLTEEEKNASVPASADSFVEGLNRIGDVDFVDKFDAIDRLNLAISGIQFVNPLKDNKVEKE